MTVTDKIREKLARYPELTWKVNGDSVCIFPASTSGFSVGMKTDRGRFEVYFDGWHEHFDNEEEALDCFAFGLSDQCRLKIVRRGNIACSWTVESRSGGEWTEDSTVGLLFIPFWRTKRVEYRQNTVIQTQ
jgi:hypothetical protein